VRGRLVVFAICLISATLSLGAPGSAQTQSGSDPAGDLRVGSPSLSSYVCPATLVCPGTVPPPLPLSCQDPRMDVTSYSLDTHDGHLHGGMGVVDWAGVARCDGIEHDGSAILSIDLFETGATRYRVSMSFASYNPDFPCTTIFDSVTEIHSQCFGAGGRDGSTFAWDIPLVGTAPLGGGGSMAYNLTGGAWEPRVQGFHPSEYAPLYDDVATSAFQEG